MQGEASDVMLLMLQSTDIMWNVQNCKFHHTHGSNYNTDTELDAFDLHGTPIKWLFACLKQSRTLQMATISTLTVMGLTAKQTNNERYDQTLVASTH